MDSGNSGGGGGGGVQSSSGGDDEDYDPRTESISPFFNPNSNHLSQPPPIFFDLQAHNNYLGPYSHSSPNPLLYHLDLANWSTGPNHADLVNLAGGALQPPSISSSSNQSGLSAGRPSSTTTTTTTTQGGPIFPISSSSSMPLPPPPTDHHGTNGRSTAGPATALVRNQNQNQNPKNSKKKRTRASRRAPTTVLTTNSSNFRQMVQEFTGIPAPPFAAAATPPYSRRFDDLFGAGGPAALGTLYPFRPSAQKIQPSSSSLFINSTSTDVAANASCTNSNNNNNNNNNNNTNTHLMSSSSCYHYQMRPSDHLGRVPKQAQPPSHGHGDMPNTGNSILGFQNSSLLQKSQLEDSPIPNSSLGEFGTITRENVNSNPSLGGGSFPGNGGGGGGGYRMMMINNCSAASSTSDYFHLNRDKESENVSSRNKLGTAHSWICPSDY